MKSKLALLVRRKIKELGDNGKIKFCALAGITHPTLVAFLDEHRHHIPKPENIHAIALACGYSEDDALELVKESAVERLRKSA